MFISASECNTCETIKKSHFISLTHFFVLVTIHIFIIYSFACSSTVALSVYLSWAGGDKFKCGVCKQYYNTAAYYVFKNAKCSRHFTVTSPF